MKFRLVDDWREFHRWASIRFSSLGAVLSGLGFGLSMSTGAASLAPFLPLWAVFLAGLVIFAACAIGRVLTLERKSGT